MKQQMYYAPSTGGFYNEDAHGALEIPDPAWTDPEAEAPMVPNPDCLIPADARPIPADQYAQLLAGQEAGLQIVSTASGDAGLQERPPEPFAVLRDRALSTLKSERAPLLSILDGLQSSALTKGDAAKAQAVEAAKQGLRDAPTAVVLTDGMTWEQMRQAFKLYYAGLVAKATPEVITAFREVA